MQLSQENLVKVRVVIPGKSGLVLSFEGRSLHPGEDLGFQGVVVHRSGGIGYFLSFMVSIFGWWIY
jgi:hypothetical protein